MVAQGGAIPRFQSSHLRIRCGQWKWLKGRKCSTPAEVLTWFTLKSTTGKRRFRLWKPFVRGSMLNFGGVQDDKFTKPWMNFRIQDSVALVLDDEHSWAVWMTIFPTKWWATWRIIPVSKWLITMVIVSPLNGVMGPLINGRTSWLIKWRWS